MVAVGLQGLLEKLVDSNGLLDKINKGLNAYLEKKRLFFPRWVSLDMQHLAGMYYQQLDEISRKYPYTGVLV